MVLADWSQKIWKWQPMVNGMASSVVVVEPLKFFVFDSFQNRYSDVSMTLVHVAMVLVAPRVFSVQMLRRSITAAVFWCAVLTCVSQNVIYFGYHTTWNGKFFDKNMVYERILIVVTVRRPFAVVHVHSVKRLDFLKIEVYSNHELNWWLCSSHTSRWTTACCGGCRPTYNSAR